MIDDQINPPTNGSNQTFGCVFDMNNRCERSIYKWLQSGTYIRAHTKTHSVSANAHTRVTHIRSYYTRISPDWSRQMRPAMQPHVHGCVIINFFNSKVSLRQIVAFARTPKHARTHVRVWWRSLGNNLRTGILGRIRNRNACVYYVRLCGWRTGRQCIKY